MTTRKTYELPAPTRSRDTYSTWFTGHSIEIKGDIDNDGAIFHDHRRGIITIDAHEGMGVDLTHDEARRVALALLAAVEEGEATREDTL
ncbi:hypothetical protein [Corynebacterium macclintockiae]|uniref:hypothetical protein n=1 Tax=Corynebacterium macclintockiae TaxID=2913501 RepID=UPI003EBCCD69